MAQANVPELGKWENDDNVPYTVCSDNARKTRGNKTTINPNDPQENPDMFHPVNPRTQPEAEPTPINAVEPAPEHKVTRKGIDVRHGYPPARWNENENQRDDNEPAHLGHFNLQRPAGSAKRNSSSEQSFDRSPLHSHHQGKGGRKASGPYALEVKNSENSHGSTPGKPRPKSSNYLGDESPDEGTAVPPFGAWNDRDPQSAENFTDIFDKVREERTGNMSNTPKHASYVIRNQTSQRKKCGCFCW